MASSSQGDLVRLRSHRKPTQNQHSLSAYHPPLPFNTTPIRLMKEHLASPNFSTDSSLPAFTNCAYTRPMERLTVLFTSVPQQASSVASMTSGVALFGFHKVGTRCFLDPIDGYPFFSPSSSCVATTYKWRAANWSRITSRVANACEHQV